GDRRCGSDHTHVPVAGRRHGPTYSRPDHLDHRYGVTLPGIGQARRRGAVAGDHEQLHAVVDETVQTGQRRRADLGDRLGPVRDVRGVAQVPDLLAGELIENGARHRQSTDPRVEDPDGSVRHAAEPTLANRRTKSSQGRGVTKVTSCRRTTTQAYLTLRSV